MDQFASTLMQWKHWVHVLIQIVGTGHDMSLHDPGLCLCLLGNATALDSSEVQ